MLKSMLQCFQSETGMYIRTYVAVAQENDPDLVHFQTTYYISAQNYAITYIRWYNIVGLGGINDTFVRYTYLDNKYLNMTKILTYQTHGHVSGSQENWALHTSVLFTRRTI